MLENFVFVYLAVSPPHPTPLWYIKLQVMLDGIFYLMAHGISREPWDKRRIFLRKELS